MRRAWILAVLAPAFGCGTMAPVSSRAVTAPAVQATAGGVRASDYYPMGEDLRWTYEDGPKQAVLPRKPRSQWFLDIRRGDEGSSMIGIEMRNQDRAGQVIQNNLGVFFAPQQGDTIGPRHVLLKNPLLIGSGWEIVATPEMTVKAKVLGIEMVVVPAGTYGRCFKLQLTNASPGKPDVAYANRWLAPGVGMVKQENLSADGTVTSISQLRQFASGMAASDDEINANRDLFAQRHFADFDSNHDGFLSAYEVGPPDLYDKADKNHDGKLTFAEFHDSEMYRFQITQQLEQASREFWAFDLDFDMQLNQNEALRQNLINLPRPLSAKDLKAVDRDDNGKLGYREFHVLYQQLWKESLAKNGKLPQVHPTK